MGMTGALLERTLCGIGASKRSGAANHRGSSKQDVETPPDLIAAVERRFGKLAVDLAATPENAKAPRYIWTEQDSLTADWESLMDCEEPDQCGPRWLNPPFGKIEPWAAKCAAAPPCLWSPILLLVPASVGAGWWWRHVHEKARVLFLAPRVKFVGHSQAFPKDLALCVYCTDPPGYETWRWK
jgi:phage N-6-adenine-methyltransferase